MKECSKCGKTKQNEDFSFRGDGSKNLRSYCKECRRNENYIVEQKYFPKTKICRICGEEKDIDLFPLRKDSLDGRRGECKKCRAEKDKKYRSKNLEKILSVKKKYYEENKEDILYKCKIYRNKRENKDRRNALRKEQYNNDEKTKLKRNMRSIISRKVRTKENSTFESLGYSIDDLINSLHERFENKDKFKECLLSSDYHIDHIIPDNLYNYESTEDEDFKKCWSYRNLRLIRAENNLSKNTEIDFNLIDYYGIEDLLPEGIYEDNKRGK